MNFRKLWAICLLFPALSGFAQQAEQVKLSLSDAIEAALRQNFDIRIAQNELEQAATNNTIGNAGMLPSVTAVGGYNTSMSDTRLELASGQVQDRDNALSRGLNGGIQLNWVLFDGMRMFINKQRLQQLENMGELALKQQVQASVAQVITTYAEVVRQQQQLIAIDTAAALARVRMELAQKKFEIGTAAKTDYLQAQVDYNASRSAALSQSAVLRQAKDSLMILMGRNQFMNYEVEDSLYLNKSLQYRELDQWLHQNLAVQNALGEKRLSEYDLRWANGGLLPTVGLTGAYTYNRTASDAGFALFNRTVGPQAGVSISVPLFNGFNLRREQKVARQEVFRQDLRVQKLQNSIAARYRTAWRSYDNARKTLELEQENISFAAENLMIQQARFRVGVANTLELREAETSYVTALSRLVDAGYTLKVTETRLLELENRLLQ
jgi:outer membrane protein